MRSKWHFCHLNVVFYFFHRLPLQPPGIYPYLKTQSFQRLSRKRRRRSQVKVMTLPEAEMLFSVCLLMLTRQNIPVFFTEDELSHLWTSSSIRLPFLSIVTLFNGSLCMLQLIQSLIFHNDPWRIVKANPFTAHLLSCKQKVVNLKMYKHLHLYSNANEFSYHRP